MIMIKAYRLSLTRPTWGQSQGRILHRHYQSEQVGTTSAESSHYVTLLKAFASLREG